MRLHTKELRKAKHKLNKIGIHILSIAVACTSTVGIADSAFAETVSRKTLPIKTTKTAPTTNILDVKTKDLLIKMLSSRKNQTKLLIDSAVSQKRLKESQANNYFSQLNAINTKLTNQMSYDSLAVERAIEIADELDSLAMRVAKDANLRIFPNVIKVNNLVDPTATVLESPGFRVEVLSLTPKGLNMLVDERIRTLKKAAMASPFMTPKVVDRYNQEINTLNLMRKRTYSLYNTSSNGYLPVAISYDVLGQRVAGIVTGYEFLPLTPIPVKPDAEIASKTDLDAARLNMEATLYNGIVLDDVTPKEYVEACEQFAKIVAMQKDFAKDGSVSDAEETKISNAFEKLQRRLKQTVVYN